MIMVSFTLSCRFAQLAINVMIIVALLKLLSMFISLLGDVSVVLVF